MHRVSAKCRKAILNCIAQHETFRRAYFWHKDMGNKQSRRSRVKWWQQTHPPLKIETREGIVIAEPRFDIPARTRVEYRMGVFVVRPTGERVPADVRAIKRILG